MSDSIHVPTTTFDQVIADHLREKTLGDLDNATRHFDPMDKSVILVDGPNFYGTIKALGLSVDYAKFFDYFRKITRVASINYFTAVSDDPIHAPLKDMLTWMRSNGIRVHTRDSVKGMVRDQVTGEEKVLWSGNMDAEIIVCALEECRRADHIILVSGDGDFVPMVKACQRRGQKFTVVSSHTTKPSYLSRDLANTTDGYINLEHLEPYIQWNPGLSKG